MLDIYATLEINRVLEEVSSFAKTEIGLNKVRTLRMLDESESSHALALVNEMTSFILRFGAVPILSSFL